MSTQEITSLKPHEQVAAQFMAHKGYRSTMPIGIERLDDELCWYFDYLLPEGQLELEVYWNGREWEVKVITFDLLDRLDRR